MRVNKPPMIYFGHLHLKYRGKNHTFFQERRLLKIEIIEIDYNLEEELVVSLTTFDGTEVKFSMASSNLYIKENGKYVLQEEQSYCSLELLLTDKIMLFDGFMSYRKNFEGSFSYTEDYEVRITIDENPLLLQTWIQHEQTIITN